MMPVWSEDLSEFTVGEVVQSQDENRAWYRQVRSKVNALMDTKLAKQISPEEYAAAHKLLKADLAECERRGRMLANAAVRARKHGKASLVSRILDDRERV